MLLSGCVRRGERCLQGAWQRHCSGGSGGQTEPPSGTAASSRLRNRAAKQQRREQRLQDIEARAGVNAEQEVKEKGHWSHKDVLVYTQKTQPGEKKDTSGPLPAAYSPGYVEATWYPWWEKQGFFRPEYHAQMKHARNETFSLCFPPPNVTGSLHLGHALTAALQDARVRWRRMQGHKVLWIPGCDHAGIATQVVVERQLWKDQGLRREEMSREEFVSEVWRWKAEKGDEIYHQLRRLGASLDWERSCFTLDPRYSEAVTEGFVRLHEGGCVYRDQGLVNWSCALRSTISDIEVQSRSVKGITHLSVPGHSHLIPFGQIFLISFVTEDLEDEVVVATTRPETMFGDVAIAVHPEDQRYIHLHGSRFRHPFNSRLLPLLTDTSIQPELGTGAVKVTPAHDHTDYHLALRHSLPIIHIFNQDGTMNSHCDSWLQGQPRFDARRLILEALMERGLHRGSEEHSLVLPVCSRTGDIIEPFLRSQWFVRCKKMATQAIAAVDSGRLCFTPSFHQKTWKTWLSDISDWCVSRQLWWGHRIPAYQVSNPDSETQDTVWVSGRTEAEARRKASQKLGIPESELSLRQDEDVLDTWFSSAIFPFAALGWPHPTDDLREFYPGSVLETGSDLIFFWVARMVMFGQELTGQLPFPQVLFHSMVRDSHGRKMSKSLGNVIDPLDVINGASAQYLHQKLGSILLDAREMRVAEEGQKRDFPYGIPECGTDALRFSLCSTPSQDTDLRLDVAAVLAARHFCNKVWNSVKFTLSSVTPDFQPRPPREIRPLSAIDRWVCSRLHVAVTLSDRGFHSNDLSTVTRAVHSFWLHDLCDVYLECVKPVLRAAADGDPDGSQANTVRQILVACTDQGLRLLSPFMPFLTEELWQRLPSSPSSSPPAPSVCVSAFPQLSSLPGCHSEREEKDFRQVQDVVKVVRNLRADYHLTTGRPEVYIRCSDSVRRSLSQFLEPLCVLSRSASVRFLSPGSVPPSHSVSAPVSDQCTVYLQGLSDPRVETQTLVRKRQRLQQQLHRLLNVTTATAYQQKVPENVRQQHTEKIRCLRAELLGVDQRLSASGSIPDSSNTA
ncbi:valine--tRNA ligase, mitochondrial [Callorhinchus milii]|uniref:valine--tRNA ligase, mitochondrial n=1 Tax=Callorhinchus milii TaxID=7868 RepID=UPI001C3FD065|nr:valine--tRNA ligase, mitochondrial [Callorhinchus milii]